MDESGKMYMVLDDTVDIGKDLVEPKTEEETEFLRRAKALKEKFMKK